MASVSAPPDLSPDSYTLYHCVDDCLSQILIFYGHVSTGASITSSRIQVAIFTCAGWQHYPRITVSPTSPLYTAVNHLPREKQGDQVCRGLAVTLLKYFAELSDDVRNALTKRAQKTRGSSKLPKMFDEMHAAEIANRMEKADNTVDVIKDVQAAYAEKVVSSVDVDLMLPGICFQQRTEGSTSRASTESEDMSTRYGMYSDVVEQLGETIFIPNSKVRRAPSKSSSVSKGSRFATGQKEALRLSMCEIVDTEERYVAKLYDLVHSVIKECRQRAKSKAATSSSPDEETLQKLFPPCLDDILEVNIGFLNAIRSSLEATEVEAFQDISKGMENNAVPKRHDPLGAVAFGKTMLEWFPKFSEPYKQYMRVQPSFSSTLTAFMKDPNSTFTRRVQETGEQKLRSLLMEPVQRLPRYSLLIDAMTATMPPSHPALRHLLKARDVVTEICSLDSPGSDDELQTHHRLKNLVERWPSSPISQRRLITAIDIASLRPPFRLDGRLHAHSWHMLLLFPDAIVLLEKSPECTISSRGLLANLDKAATFSLSQMASSGQSYTALQYVWSEPLSGITLSHSTCGRLLHLICKSSNADLVSGTFALVGADEGKASRFCEDVTKAHVESRFSDQERCSDRWSLHSFQSSSLSVKFFATVCEDESGTTFERQGSAPFRIVFGKSKLERQRLLSAACPIAIASISKVSSRYKLEVDHIFGSGSVDVTSLEELLNTLSRRLCILLSKSLSPENVAMASSLVALNSRILAAIAPQAVHSSKSYRTFRPPSPTKLLASFLGAGSGRDGHSAKSGTSAPVLTEIPSFRPTPATTSYPSTPSLERSDSKVKLVSTSRPNTADDALGSLEQTLTAYVLSLRSRAGNIVGRTLRSREFADPVSVNDLYNVLLEDPGKIQAAAEVSNDVLFAAFEKFVWNAWEAQIGAILSIDVLQSIQRKFESSLPMEFDTYFRELLSSLSPQNSRALTALIKLLADLLDASGNDGDRGALTVAFAELLSRKNEPLAYISLLDRLVDDYEKLFDDSTTVGFPTEEYPFNASSSHGNATKTGSVSSQNSSFRKRFGFGLSRDNSKHENESKVSSIIRSLSKNKSGNEANSQPSSLSKGSLVRSRSTDSDSRLTSFLRPVSRDRAFASNTSLSSEQAYSSRPNSSHSSVHVLEAIGELPSTIQKSSPKKKRRSSLSDLPPLHATPKALDPLDFSPIQLRSTLGLTGTPTSSPLRRSPSPPPVSASPTRVSATRLGSPIRVQARKENITPPTMSKLTSPNGSSLPRPTGTSPPKGYLSERAINRTSDEVFANSNSPRKRAESRTSIPTPKPASRERPFTSHANLESPSKKVATQTSPQKAQKLRMQSPHKLRERLNKEKQSMVATETGLQAEITKLGEELSLARPQSSGSPLKSSVLQARVTTLEAKLQSVSTDFTSRITAAQKDLETSLATSERRMKKLDELYKEATAENDALYDRFNKELAKVVRSVKAGPAEGVDELRSRLSEATSELQRTKKENWRLKREIAGLKAQADVTSGPKSSGEILLRGE